jgi:hypothetical protein
MKKSEVQLSKRSRGSRRAKHSSVQKPTTRSEAVTVASIPLVGFAHVNADGTIDVSKVNRNIVAHRVSKGCYHVKFDTNQTVTAVWVLPDHKPRTPRVVATVRPTIQTSLEVNKFNTVEIFIATAKAFRDCSFAIMGAADGVPNPKVIRAVSRKVKKTH